MSPLSVLSAFLRNLNFEYFLQTKAASLIFQNAIRLKVSLAYIVKMHDLQLMGVSVEIRGNKNNSILSGTFIASYKNLRKVRYSY